MSSLFCKIIKTPWLAVLLVLALANVAIYWQFYIRHLLPFPGDLLVSFYFPWNSGGFAGFDPWTTHKDVISADAIRQIYPWKNFGFSLLKSGVWPLWNPFNFSGQPLLANLQTSFYFPTGIMFFLLPTIWAWIGQVIGLPLLLAVFSYLFLRSVKLSRLAGILGAVFISNLSYLSVWSEQLVIIQSLVFLPFCLWLVNRFDEKKELVYLVLVSMGLAFSIFGGHIQTAFYVYLIVIAYALFKKVSWPTLFLVLLLSVVLTAVQLLPSLELYKESARQGYFFAIYQKSILPWKNLVTIFAPDFFGNPATKNFWGQDYGNFQVYFGVVATILSLRAIIVSFASKTVKFFLVLGVFGLLLATSPVAPLLYWLKIPILSATAPARAIFIFQFSFAILAAFGVDHFLSFQKLSKKSWWWSLALVGAIYVSLWGGVLVGRNPNFLISRTNLILPTAIFLITAFTLILPSLKRFSFLERKPSFLILLFVCLLEYAYFLNKFQPFSKGAFVFPSHPIINYLQQNAKIDRFFGLGTAYIDNNFATYFGINSAEGYDSLFPKRYGELLTSTNDGSLPTEIPRSDALFSSQDSQYRSRLFDLLGVKFLLDKNDNPKTNWEPELDKFPQEKYQLVWQNYKWKVYQRKTVLPRAFLVNEFEVINSSREIINRLYNSDFDYRHRVILEQNPPFLLTPSATGSATIVSYGPNRVEIDVRTNGNLLLFLSDTFYPGWQARWLGKGNSGKMPILRADYALRAIPISSQMEKVILEYQPLSFQIGLIVSGLTWTTLASLLLILTSRKRFHK